MSDANAKALAAFTDYFVRNYPGPDTIISDPRWHAPRIFRAVAHALVETDIAPADAEQHERATPVAWLRHGESVPVQGVPFGAMWITDKDDPSGFPVYAAPPVTVQEPVAVKALEWIETPGGNLCASSVAGRYSTFRYSEASGIDLRRDGDSLGENYKSLEAAKAAAQADYEQRIRSALSTSQSGPASEIAAHPDDLAVDRFAAAMKAKLAKKRGEGYSGWDSADQCSIEYLSQLLVSHIDKGDPIDIANFAMMIHQRGGAVASYQSRVNDWMLACFDEAVAADMRERPHRFLEEALELAQSAGCSKRDALQLVCYVFGRPAGDPRQEAGGTLLTLAALCTAIGVSMDDAAEAELARVSTPEMISRLRAKNAAKDPDSPLPGIVPDRQEAVR